MSARTLPSLHLPVIALAGALVGLGLYVAAGFIGGLTLYVPVALALLLAFELSRIILGFVMRQLRRLDPADIPEPLPEDTTRLAPAPGRRNRRTELTLLGAGLLAGLGAAYLIWGPLAAPTPLSSQQETGA